MNHVTLDVADALVYLYDEAAGLVDDIPTGFPHFGYVVSDVDAAYDELSESGVEFVMEPTTFGDLRIACLRNPEEVRLKLLEYE